MSDLVIDNPYTLAEEIRRPHAGPAEVERVLDAARSAAASWARSPVAERVQLCLRAVEEMEAAGESIATDITRMMGKPLRQARNEIAGMAKRARHMAAIAEASLADVVLPEREGFERRIVRTPVGVVFNLPAWNYPLLTAVNVVVPAVLAGNAVVLKHSSRSALCGEHFADAFARAGAPAGLVQALHCDHATSERIAGDRRVGYVAFTGSVQGGRRIYQAVAAGHFADAGLELGGNDAAYVAPDADVEKAADGLVDGACYNAGQSCCGVERVYVHRDVYERFVEAALALARAYRLGDPTADDVTMGPMAQPNAPAFLEAQVKQAVEQGAKLALGGKPTRVDGRGRFFEPTVLLNPSPASDVMRVESFGPILPIAKVASDEEALARMNDDELGLTAAVWTRDRDRAARLAERLEVGTVYMNQCDTLDPALPWTGHKDSGKGSTLSHLGFLHLTKPKALNFKLP